MLTTIIFLLIFLGAASLTAYLLAPSEDEAVVRLRLRELRLAAGHPEALEDLELSQPLLRRLLGPMVGRLQKSLLTRTPQGTREMLRARLREAGDPVGIGAFLAARLYAGAATFLVYFLLISGSLPSSGLAGGTALALGAAYAGSVLPSFWLGSVVARRKKAIQQMLPEVMDILCVSVEAGLGLDGAMQKVTERLPGPLAQELGLCLKEINLGKSREEAWRGLGERVNVPDMNVVVSAILQAEKMGASLSTVLRIQSADMRQRRRLRAEEKARQAPIKLMFPLVIFIFPAIFAVILGPAVIQIMHTL